MDRATRKRWVILLGALAATVVAMAYPINEESGTVEIVAPTVPRPAATQYKNDVQENDDLAWVANDEDPFAPRGWLPPAAAAAGAPPVAPAPVAATLNATPPPPELPYKFVGQMKNGDDRTVYLGRGEQVLLVHEGDVLEGTYKVLAIGQVTIEFELVSSGLKQTLAIPAQEN